MKKVVIFILAALFMTIGAACSIQTEPDEAETQPPAQTATDEPDAKETSEENKDDEPETSMPVQDEPSESQESETTETTEANTILLEVGEYTFTATLADNSTGEALVEKLAEGPVTINMRDYGSMEKVGGFGFNLPTNDEQISTEPGDLILYQGSAFVIYYAPNSWNFTRIGKINDVTTEELKEALGSGDVTVTILLP